MPSVAEVQFKASGQQQVVGAFKSVGDSAATATTKVQQNSGAMKSMGQGMKSSIGGIAAVGTAFATLSLSIVGTWRAYRDLGDAQIAVDKANLRVKKTTEAIRKTEAEIAIIRKEEAKGSLESVSTTNKIRLAQQKLAAARKDGKHTALELQVMQDDINLAMKEGSGVSKKLTDAENKLALQKEQLGVQTDVAGEAQERFNDVQQDFYLSLLPTALSGIASLSLAFGGLKGVLGGGAGGILGMLGPIGLGLGAISLAVIAFQTNFLGLRDKIGGVITWFKERFGAWKATLEEVFGFIQKGDWAGAFNRIKEAALAFWEDLKRSVPFFGQVDSIINKIRGGDWTGAFHDIHLAAVQMWNALKKQVPFFGGVETFIRQIAAGDWSGAWNTVKAGAVTFWQALVKAVPFFGDLATYLRTKLELANATAKNLFSQLAKDLAVPFAEINAGLAKLGQGDIVGGFGGIVKGIDAAIVLAKAALFNWVKTNFGIDLKALESQATAIGNTIITKIGEGLTFVARTWIDPIVTALLNPATWTTAFLTLGGGVVAIGTAIWNFIGGAIAGAAADPKGAGDWWGKIGTAIWTGITGWFETNLPDAKAAMEAIAKKFTDAANASSVWFQNIGIAIWNQIVEGMKLFNPQLGALFDQLKVKPIEVTANTKPAETAIQKWTANTQSLKPKIGVGADTKQANKQSRDETIRINKMRATIKVMADTSMFMSQMRNLQANAPVGSRFRRSATGTNTTVKRPTMFMAGEGGRPEDVYIKPRGSAGQRPGGEGFSGTINVFVDGVQRPARYSMGSRK